MIVRCLKSGKPPFLLAKHVHINMLVELFKFQLSLKIIKTAKILWTRKPENLIMHGSKSKKKKIFKWNANI